MQTYYISWILKFLKKICERIRFMIEKYHTCDDLISQSVDNYSTYSIVLTLKWAVVNFRYIINLFGRRFAIRWRLRSKVKRGKFNNHISRVVNGRWIESAMRSESIDKIIVRVSCRYCSERWKMMFYEQIMQKLIKYSPKLRFTLHFCVLDQFCNSN